MPLNGNLDNNGLSDITAINNGATVGDNGKLGKCYSFNGSSNYITIPSFSIPENFSISIWGKWNSLNNWSRLVDFGSLASGKGYGFLIANSNTSSNMYFAYECGTGASNNIFIGTITINTWYHIAATFQGTDIKLYLNGNLITTITSASPVGGHTLNYNYLGKSNWSPDALLNGSLNDFRIYDHCLSPLEIKQISQGLICHYKLSGVGGENYFINSNSGVSYTSTKNSTYADVRMIINNDFWTRDNHNNYAVSFDWEISKSLPETKSCNLHWSASPWYGLKALVIPANTTSGHYEYIGNNIPAKDFSTDNIFVRIGSTDGVESSWLAQNPGIIFKLKNFKLEIGSKATPWCPNPADTLYSTLGFNDGIEYDCSGYGNNGTKIGNISWSGDSSRYSGSYYLGGTGYIKNSSFNFIASQMTVALWIKIPATITAQHFLFGTFNKWTGNGIGYWRDVGDNHHYSGILKSSVESRYADLATPALTANTWYHIAIVYTGTECILYVNGVENKRVTYGKNGTIANPVCYLGNSLFNNTPSSETDESSMSDFRIYATALSSDDIKSLYSTSVSIDKTGVLTAYEFTETEGE